MGNNKVEGRRPRRLRQIHCPVPGLKATLVHTLNSARPRILLGPCLFPEPTVRERHCLPFILCAPLAGITFAQIHNTNPHHTFICSFNPLAGARSSLIAMLKDAPWECGSSYLLESSIARDPMEHAAADHIFASRGSLVGRCAARAHDKYKCYSRATNHIFIDFLMTKLPLEKKSFRRRSMAS
jgi:hypothetical protein